MAGNDPESPSVAQSPSTDNSENDGLLRSITRPKRRKARRACLACQRAHLTCADERPCQRCVKRGLQGSCHDGVRKKAKYLHDAPNDVLVSGTSTPFLPRKNTFSGVGKDDTKTSTMMNRVDGDNIPVAGLGPRDYSPPLERTASASSALLQTIRSDGTDQNTSLSNANSSGFDPNFLDPADSTFFNFDLASMNFGNHYGALEFGMLGQLSSGANDQFHKPNRNRHSSTTYGAPSISSSVYHDSLGPTPSYNADMSDNLPDWQANPSGHGLQMNTWGQNISAGFELRRQSHEEPHAYSIGAVPTDVAELSPGSSIFDKTQPTESRFTDLNLFPNGAIHDGDQLYTYQQMLQTSNGTQSRPSGRSEAISQKLGNAQSQMGGTRRRRRDASTIYSSVTRPYPYTLGFHALTAYLQRRFSSQKRLAIAQALASIRPSFISCTRTLMDDDLIFMEKCFQRQLVEYEDFIGACGTPTIVCRRTGEVAYAGKEFSLLTGWTKDILLGKAPNLNINGYSPSGTLTASSRTGMNTPRAPAETGRSEGMDTMQPARPQAVFLAELLDDDSVVQFYEDFAKLAFADSKGSAWCACKLLKYKSKDERVAGFDNGYLEETADERALHDDALQRMRSNEDASKQGTALQRQRNRNVVDCMYCWTVRRDVFDIPMMIVINFLPVI